MTTSLLTATVLVFSAALPAAGAPAVPEDRAAEFRVPACSTAAAAGWKVVENPWVRARVPEGWGVLDRAGALETAPSTTGFRSLSVYLDAGLKAKPKPALALYGRWEAGKAPADGMWLAQSLSDARARGDLPLGQAGTVPVAGRGACQLGAVERDARGDCPGGPTPYCRRGVLHLDCGAKDGVQLLVVAVTPPYPNVGRPEGKAAETLAQIKTFLCTLEYKK